MLGRINRNYLYDFNDQKWIGLHKQVQKGDELVTHCIYDTTSKTTITYGGEGTSEEMCFSVYMYYPKVDATFCGSRRKSGVKIWDSNEPHYRPDKDN